MNFDYQKNAFSLSRRIVYVSIMIFFEVGQTIFFSNKPFFYKYGKIVWKLHLWDWNGWKCFVDGNLTIFDKKSHFWDAIDLQKSSHVRIGLIETLHIITQTTIFGVMNFSFKKCREIGRNSLTSFGRFPRKH